MELPFLSTGKCKNFKPDIDDKVAVSLTGLAFIARNFVPHVLYQNHFIAPSHDNPDESVPETVRHLSPLCQPCPLSRTPRGHPEWAGTGLLHPGRECCHSQSTTIRQPPSSCRSPLQHEHVRPSGLLCHWPNGLELAARQAPRPIDSFCRQLKTFLFAD